MRYFGTFTLVAALFAGASPAAGDLSDDPPSSGTAVAMPIPAETPDTAASPPIELSPKATPDVPARPARPDLPAAPRKYLEAGAQLFNKARFDMAGTYLHAAHVYRDRLTPSERVVLDVYREKLVAYLKGADKAPVDDLDPGVVPVNAVGSIPPAALADPVTALTRRPEESESELVKSLLAPAPGLGPSTTAGSTTRTAPALGLGSTAWRGTSDSKQKARWLLQLAREQILKGNYDVAAQAIAEARGIDVEWTLFDETPDRLADALEKARSKGGAGSQASPLGAPDKKSAKLKLREARAALQANDLDRADAIVREVRSFGVAFNFFEDTPDRVASAIYDARRREAVRNAELTVKSYYNAQEPVPVQPTPGAGLPPIADPR